MSGAADGGDDLHLRQHLAGVAAGRVPGRASRPRGAAGDRQPAGRPRSPARPMSRSAPARGRGRGWMSIELMPVDFTPMCAPSCLAADRGRAARPAARARRPAQPAADQPRGLLVGPVVRRRRGRERRDGRASAGLRLDSQADEGHAAMGGQGFVLLTPAFWKNDIADGRLVPAVRADRDRRLPLLAGDRARAAQRAQDQALPRMAAAAGRAEQGRAAGGGGVRDAEHGEANRAVTSSVGGSAKPNRRPTFDVTAPTSRRLALRALGPRRLSGSGAAGPCRLAAGLVAVGKVGYRRRRAGFCALWTEVGWGSAPVASFSSSSAPISRCKSPPLDPPCDGVGVSSSIRSLSAWGCRGVSIIASLLARKNEPRRRDVPKSC